MCAFWNKGEFIKARPFREISTDIWTTACEKLNEHALKSPAHKTAMIKCENFIRIMKAEQTLIDHRFTQLLLQT